MKGLWIYGSWCRGMYRKWDTNIVLVRALPHAGMQLQHLGVGGSPAGCSSQLPTVLGRQRERSLSECQHRADSSGLGKRGSEEEAEVVMEGRQGEVASQEQSSHGGICQPAKNLGYLGSRWEYCSWSIFSYVCERTFAELRMRLKQTSFFFPFCFGVNSWRMFCSALFVTAWSARRSITVLMLAVISFIRMIRC